MSAALERSGAPSPPARTPQRSGREASRSVADCADRRALERVVAGRIRDHAEQLARAAVAEGDEAHVLVRCRVPLAPADLEAARLDERGSVAERVQDAVAALRAAREAVDDGHELILDVMLDDALRALEPLVAVPPAPLTPGRGREAAVRRILARRVAVDPTVNLDVRFREDGGAVVVVRRGAVVVVRRDAVYVTREQILAELARGLGGAEEHAAILAAVEDAIRERPDEERVRDLGRYAGPPSALDELRAASKGRWDGVDVEAFMREHRGEDA